MNYTKPYSVRLPDDLRAALEASAQADERSTHRQLLYLLRYALREHGYLATDAGPTPTETQPTHERRRAA